MQGVAYPLDHLQNKHERIEWSAFVDFMDNAGRIWNEDQLADIGGAWIRSPFFRAFAVVARLLFSARDAYRFINKADSGAGNQVFACIRPTHIEVGPYHVVLEMRLPDDYPRSRPFWVTTKGGLAAIPQLMALKPARVELQETPWGARYDIHYPRGGAWLALVARVVTWPFTLRNAARELKEANEVLKARYADLEEARGVLALQATQLSVAHTISQLIHRDLDIGRTLEAMAEALVHAGNYACAEVKLSAVVDGSLLELRASNGQPNDGTPLDAALQSRGRVIGDVRVWHAPEHDPRERGQLLEFVLPTLSMALDNAISYRELAQYRDSLELRVAERTAELTQARDQLAQTVRSLEEAQEVRDRIFANINHEIPHPAHARAPRRLRRQAAPRRRARRAHPAAARRHRDVHAQAAPPGRRSLALGVGSRGQAAPERRRRRPRAAARRRRRHVAPGGRAEGHLDRLPGPPALRAQRRPREDRARGHQPHLQRRQVHAVGRLGAGRFSSRI